MKKHLKMLASLLVACTAALWSATGMATNTLVFNLGDEPATLDPSLTSGQLGMEVELQIFEGLVDTDPVGKTIPAGAVSWERSADGLTWTFHLRKEAKWSNGQPVTAKDYVYSWRRLVDPQTGAPYATYLAMANVKNAQAIVDGKMPASDLGVKAVDDFTFQVTLTTPTPYFLDMMSIPVLYPLPQATIEKYGTQWTQPQNIVVNGAYMLKEWVVNGHLLLERNKTYYNDANTKIDQVKLLEIQSAQDSLNRYLAGELDISAVPPDQFKRIKAELPKEFYTAPVLSTSYFIINVSKAPFTDAKVRRALSLAFNRKVITDKILAQGQIPAYNLTPPYTANFKPYVTSYQNESMGDRVAEARKLLQEAGYSPSNKLSFTLLYVNGGEIGKRLALAAKAIWESTGLVHVDLMTQEWKTYLSTRLQGNYQMAMAGWGADYNEPSTFLNLLVTGNSNNDGRYSNAQYDAIMAKTLLASTTDEERLKLYQEAEQIIAQDAPVIPNYYSVRVGVKKPYVNGWSVTNPIGYFYFKNMSLSPKK